MSSCLTPYGVFEYFWHGDFTCVDQLALPIVWASPTWNEYFPALGVTLLIEAPFYFIAMRLSRSSWARGLLCLLLCNLATHPLIHYAILPLAVQSRWRVIHFVLFAEIFAIVAEAAGAQLILQKRSWKTAAFVVAANLVSWSFSTN